MNARQKKKRLKKQIDKFQSGLKKTYCKLVASWLQVGCKDKGKER